jgi:hypothetical protein
MSRSTSRNPWKKVSPCGDLPAPEREVTFAAAEGARGSSLWDDLRRQVRGVFWDNLRYQVESVRVPSDW